MNLEFTKVTPIDGKKLGAAKDAKPEGVELKGEEVRRTADQQTVLDADQRGDRKTLLIDALIPSTMAVIYLLILMYFKSIGGYRAVSLSDVSK